MIPLDISDVAAERPPDESAALIDMRNDASKERFGRATTISRVWS
jgi:hypothetical protein